MNKEQKVILSPLAKQITKVAKKINLPESEWMWIEDQRDYKWGILNYNGKWFRQNVLLVLLGNCGEK